MKTIKILGLSTLFLLIFGFISSKNSYKIAKTFDIQITDTSSIFVNQVIDKNTNEIAFYYSDFIVPACNTGECKLINLRMYWDCFGNYFKYEAKKDNPLTKYNHKKFKKREYSKLQKILCDTSLVYKSLNITDLTDEESEKKYKTDAMSGATLKIFSDKNRIKQAVKTVYTLWHIANGNVYKTLKDEIEINTKENNTLEQIIKEKNKEKLLNLNIAQFSHLLKLIESKQELKNKENFKFINNSLKGTYDDKTILLADFYVRNKIKSSIPKKIFKKTVFVK